MALLWVPRGWLVGAASGNPQPCSRGPQVIVEPAEGSPRAVSSLTGSWWGGGSHDPIGLCRRGPCVSYHRGTQSLGACLGRLCHEGSMDAGPRAHPWGLQI